MVLFLWAPACLDPKIEGGCSDSNTGEIGELSNAYFHYACAGEEGDVWCDTCPYDRPEHNVRIDGFECLGFEEDMEGSFPTVATGAVFGMDFDMNEGVPVLDSYHIKPASTAHVELVGQYRYRMRHMGPTAFLLLGENDDVVDFVHVWGRPPSSIDLCIVDTDRSSGDSMRFQRVPDDGVIEISEDESVVLAAHPGGGLAGMLPGAWRVTDSDVVRVSEMDEGPSSQVELRAVSTGTTFVTVTLGEAVRTVEIQVLSNGEIPEWSTGSSTADSDAIPSDGGVEEDAGPDAGADSGADAERDFHTVDGERPFTPPPLPSPDGGAP